MGGHLVFVTECCQKSNEFARVKFYDEIPAIYFIDYFFNGWGGHVIS